MEGYAAWTGSGVSESTHNGYVRQLRQLFAEGARAKFGIEEGSTLEETVVQLRGNPVDKGGFCKAALNKLIQFLADDPEPKAKRKRKGKVPLEVEGTRERANVPARPSASRSGATGVSQPTDYASTMLSSKGIITTHPAQESSPVTPGVPAQKWSPGEDAKLLKIMAKVEPAKGAGNGWSWTQVAEAHGTRSSSSCRQRFQVSRPHTIADNCG